MEPILEMTKELARALQQDERFVKMQMAAARADEDADLQALIGEFNLKRMAINEEASKGDAQNEEKMSALNKEIQEVYAKVMANESMMEYQKVKVELDKLTNAISAILNMAQQGMDPDEYEEHSCDGHCGSCGGCH